MIDLSVEINTSEYWMKALTLIKKGSLSSAVLGSHFNRMVFARDFCKSFHTNGCNDTE